jgi:cellulose 1,4-beta-cellobiosidase
MLTFLTVAALIVSCFGQNPFEGAIFYSNSYWQAEVSEAINEYPNDAAAMKVAQNQSVFFWIDSMARIANLSVVLDGASSLASSLNSPVVVGIIIYDLPDRDCDALASNGEIVCADSACTAGIQEYETQYIDPIYQILQKYTDNNLRLVLLIEPDSLPNLATNLDNPTCAQAQTAYETGISYAVKTFSQQSNIYQYIDAAHGGWLGWPNNMQSFVQIVSKVLQNAGGNNVVRGFASNTANYQPLGSLSSTADPCNLESQYNNCINEAIYIQTLDQSFQSAGMTGYRYITDTSRNGVTNERQDCANWCNINGAGLGQRPSASTSSVTGSSIIDAFVWSKVPGESDGTSNTSASNYDAHCSSEDSKQPAPQAGVWWPEYFDMLVQNAVPPLN